MCRLFLLASVDADTLCFRPYSVVPSPHSPYSVSVSVAHFKNLTVRHMRDYLSTAASDNNKGELRMGWAGIQEEIGDWRWGRQLEQPSEATIAR